MPCEECERLWRAYENAVFEHVRLCSKLKVALAASPDGDAAADLENEVLRAEDKRAAMRDELTRHETAERHGAPALVR